nr:MAG TPA: hypothetical protein [Caudoviricetes sp.]
MLRIFCRFFGGVKSFFYLFLKKVLTGDYTPLFIAEKNKALCQTNETGQKSKLELLFRARFAT